jgi:hypothetical protein
MYLEKLRELTYEDYTNIYPSLKRNSCFLLGENDFNLVFYIYKQDIKYIIFKLLKIKYPLNEFKTGTYKTNQFQYNEMAYIIDCNNFYGLELKDFIQEYTALKSIYLKPNLFIFLNIQNIDIETQILLGSCVETCNKTSRYWFCSNNIEKTISKIRVRTLQITLMVPDLNIIKKKIIELLDKPTFEIIIDKIAELSNGDIGKALILIDIFKLDPNILNRKPFIDELVKIKNIIKDKDLTNRKFSDLREICFRLIERADLIEIVRVFIVDFIEFFNNDQIKEVIKSLAIYQSKDKIYAKQTLILESWLIDCILIYRNDIDKEPKYTEKINLVNDI